MIMAASLALICGCTDSATPPAESGVILGTVTHNFADTPVAGATVSAGGRSTSTANNGTYRLDDVPQGDQVLAATAPEFRDRQRNLRVSDRQTVDLSLIPLDTLVSVTGHVFHAQDGPVMLTLQVDDRAVATGPDGRWTLDDVPMGEVRIELDHAPYVPVDRQVMISAEGQDIPLQLYRQIEVVQALTEDSYIFTGQDSLNANRGQAPVLWASPSLGRRILLGLPPVAAQWAGREVVHVQVEFFACVQPDDPQWAGEAEVAVGVHRLTGAFHENSVDFYSAPGSAPLPGMAVDAPIGLPPLQLVSVDVTESYQLINPWPGIALTVTDGHLGLFVASSEYGDDGEPEAERRPRVRFTLLD
jgi:hypothetical protein